MTESHRIEFKRQLTDTLEKEVVAFLNARQGGEIYIGVDDVSQKPIRLMDLDDLQLKIKDRIDLIANEEYGYGCLIKATDQATPQATGQVEERFETLLEYCLEPRTTAEMMQFLALKDRKSFREAWLAPLLQAGLVSMTLPDKPSSPKQKYQTTQATQGQGND
ncbi:AlbA family DNA-binding domain-containing protein [Thiomicrospira microaerophila]|uniref:AlbA family DNA-binding domain-containing protein n=1 Tax=Thiomicrospira microaerophila TaxID=406020 RepID=UPI0005C87EF2|nr:ATP-binding protein [Thiomicrospira microaerophila]